MDRQFLINKNKRKIEPLLCKYIFQERVYTDQVDGEIENEIEIGIERERESKTYTLTKKEEEITAV